MLTVWRAVVCLATLLGPAPIALAESPGVDCPPTIQVEQRTEAPEGWSPRLDLRPRRLALVTFFDGPPEHLASLKYDERVVKKDHWIATWHFRHNPRGYWISCGYDGASVSLVRVLPASVTRCQVTYERSVKYASGVPAIRQIECR